MFCFAPEIIRDVCCITAAVHPKSVHSVSTAAWTYSLVNPLCSKHCVLDECVSKQADFSKKIKQEMTETEK